MKHGLPASTVAQVHGVLSRHPEGQPNGVWLWGLGSMRAARRGHVGRALSGSGTPVAWRERATILWMRGGVVVVARRVDLRGAAGVVDASRL
ncbi:MAG: hypothetical protein RL077_925 [Verrucomicrobiota bacterium]